MNISLYELAAEYQQAAETLMAAEFDETTIADTLDSISGPLEVKAQNVVGFSRSLRAHAAAKREAAKAMMDSADRIERRAKDLEAYTLTCMQLAGIQKIECPWFTLSIAKNPPSVLIEDDRLIPQDFYTSPLPPAPSIDKKLIAQAIKDGYSVPGAKLSQGVRLAIR